jgi:hypothetical protein
VAHSLGWSAEDMERNVDYVKGSEELRLGACMLAARAVHAAQLLLEHEAAPHAVPRGGRKAHHLVLHAHDLAAPEGGEGGGPGGEDGPPPDGPG